MSLVPSRTFSGTEGQASTGNAGPDAIEADIDALIAFLTVLKGVTDSNSGADNIGMTAITETGANTTVQSVIEALITRLKAVADGTSGADLIGMTAITETGANATVQSIVEALITRLKATTDSASGADLIGATSISGLAGGTTQALLEALKAFIDTHVASATAHTAGQVTAGTLPGIVVANNNTNYTIKQIRNVTLSTADASGGSNGDVWIKYTP